MRSCFESDLYSTMLSAAWRGGDAGRANISPDHRPEPDERFPLDVTDVERESSGERSGAGLLGREPLASLSSPACSLWTRVTKMVPARAIPVLGLISPVVAVT